MACNCNNKPEQYTKNFEYQCNLAQGLTDLDGIIRILFYAGSAGYVIINKADKPEKIEICFETKIKGTTDIPQVKRTIKGKRK